MKRNTIVARVAEADAGLERIRHLAEQLAPAPVNSRQHRALSAAIRIEADAYRKSLDTEQAMATHNAQALRVSALTQDVALPVVTRVPAPRSESE